MASGIAGLPLNFGTPVANQSAQFSASPASNNVPGPNGNMGNIGVNSGGSVLGASIGPAINGNTASTHPAQQQTQQANQPAQTQQQQVDPYASIRNGISSSWDNYLGSLSGTGSYLNDQQTAQNNIANDQLSQGQNTINAQKAQSLRDISNTTRNAFQAGNNYLGSMGAGDSSAGNQYAFAINQQAGKQTGDLNNFVSTQMSNLQSTHDQQINSIANWFSQQQEALKQQIAQGTLQKGQDLNNLSSNILNQAIAATNQIKANTQNQYNALTQWAANNSGNLGQLQQNIAAIPQAMGQLSTFGGGMNQANPVAYGGYASSGAQSTPTTDIFGNKLPGQ